MLVTAVCGYAHYVAEADGGRVLEEPFAQQRMDETLAAMLADPAARARWSANALDFAEVADIYSNAEHAADVILKERE